MAASMPMRGKCIELSHNSFSRMFYLHLQLKKVQNKTGQREGASKRW